MVYNDRNITTNYCVLDLHVRSVVKPRKGQLEWLDGKIIWKGPQEKWVLTGFVWSFWEHGNESSKFIKFRELSILVYRACDFRLGESQFWDVLTSSLLKKLFSLLCLMNQNIALYMVLFEFRNKRKNHKWDYLSDPYHSMFLLYELKLYTFFRC